MHFATFLPDWNSLESVRRAHSRLEGGALVSFALLVLFDVLAHLTEGEDKGRARLFEKIGLCFFAIAVLAEIAAYPYGERNDKLSADMISSLSEKAGQAETKAKTALRDSGTALTKADAASVETNKAETSAGIALGKSNKANDAAGKALSTSNAAIDAAAKAQEQVNEVAARAEKVDRDLWQTQYGLSGRSLKDVNSLIRTLKKFKGEKVDLESFVGDAEGFFLCNSLFLAASNAEMQPTDRCGKQFPSPPFLTGILVSGPDKQEIDEFTNIVANAVTMGGAGGMHARAGSTLTVLVGSKVPFMMDKSQIFNAPPLTKHTKKQNAKP